VLFVLLLRRTLKLLLNLLESLLINPLVFLLLNLSLVEAAAVFEHLGRVLVPLLLNRLLLPV